MKGAGAIRPSDEHGGGGGGSPTAAKAAAAPPARGKKLSWPQLVGLTFFAVCGGDYGIEDSVGAAGPRLTLLGLLLLPWVWSLPIALMTAELGSMIPEAGGYVVWVHRAFGPFAAHMNALWNLVSNTFDNALYPVMFVDYLYYFPLLRVTGVARWLVSAAMLAVVTALNLVGVDVVANASNVFALLVISPFVALVVAGVPQLELEPLLAPPTRPVEWGVFLSVLLWNTSGYDSVGALAAEVAEPGRDFPRAMLVTIFLVTLVYVLPVGVGASLDAERLGSWTDGSFSRVASDHIGEWLSAWITLCGALSAVGLLNTLLCTSARVAVSAARLGILPSCLGAVHEPSGTPRRATVAISGVLLFACALPFSQLVAISMLFYGATTLFEFLALLQLRRTEPITRRPFRVPLPTPLLALATCVDPALRPPHPSSAVGGVDTFGATTAAAVATYCARGGGGGGGGGGGSCFGSDGTRARASPVRTARSRRRRASAPAETGAAASSWAASRAATRAAATTSRRRTRRATWRRRTRPTSTPS